MVTVEKTSTIVWQNPWRVFNEDETWLGSQSSADSSFCLLQSVLLIAYYIWKKCFNKVICSKPNQANSDILDQKYLWLPILFNLLNECLPIRVADGRIIESEVLVEGCHVEGINLSQVLSGVKTHCSSLSYHTETFSSTHDRLLTTFNSLLALLASKYNFHIISLVRAIALKSKNNHGKGEKFIFQCNIIQFP